MSGHAVRVLLVDDFLPWREYVRTLIAERKDLSIEAEASDGLEAIEKIKEAHPELVLLDMGLPKLNGIEVLKQALVISPSIRIIVLTQENSADFVQEAVRLGAMGYVNKADARTELLRAIDSVLQGRRFATGIVYDKGEGG